MMPRHKATFSITTSIWTQSTPAKISARNINPCNRQMAQACIMYSHWSWRRKRSCSQRGERGTDCFLTSDIYEFKVMKPSGGASDPLLVTFAKLIKTCWCMVVLITATRFWGQTCQSTEAFLCEVCMLYGNSYSSRWHWIVRTSLL